MKIRLPINGHHYHAVVSGAGSPILLLHGFTGDVSAWQNLRSMLEPSHRVIALDILGHGKSTKPSSASSYRIERVAADVIALLDQLAAGKIHLLGYSMGGRLALYLALRYADRFHSLILESASPGLRGQQARAERIRRDHQLADQIEAKGIEWFVDFWENLPLWDSQDALVKASQRRQRLNNHPLGLANSLRGMGSGAQPSLWEELPRLNLPTQLIVGELDRKFLRINREMAAAMPQAAMKVVPHAGHRVHLENPPRFHEAVMSFLHGQF